MGRKIEILGKEISITLAVLLIAASLGSAALVGYLSNTTQAEVSVSSPFELKNSDGEEYSTSEEEVAGITWDEDSSITFSIYGGETVSFSNYIKNRADVTIPCTDEETIECLSCNETDCDMTGLDQEFTFFGARYWRPEGTLNANGGLTRLADYGGDLDLGWDPYTYNNSGTIECYDAMDASARSNNIEGESWVDVKDGICYYVGAAFSYAVSDGKLVSSYPYDHYVAGIEEIMQLKMTFNPAIAPGTYRYSRQIIPQ